jgi:iron complex transport system substrate-binding protein
MKKFIAKALSGMLAVTLLTGCAGTSAASSTAAASTSAATEIPTEVTITDHQDRTITVPTDPKKVAVLDIYPLASMLTIYLDSAESIVAMEPASMSAAKNGVLSELYPEVLNVNTNIMDGNDVNIESLVALNPDVVFYNAGNKAEQQKLENAGLTAVAVSATKWNYDCIKTYNEWMSLLDQIYPSHASNREDLVNQYSNDKYNEIQSKVSSISEKQKVLFLFQYDDKTMITSSSSFFGQWWCDAVGAENVAHDVQADNSNAKITMEQVYSWNPDVIIITNFTPLQNRMICTTMQCRQR